MANPRSTSVRKLVWVALCVALPWLWAPGMFAAGGDASDQFFDPGSSQTIHLDLKPEDLERLRRALPTRIVVPGTFRWQDQTVAEVGVRFKGDSSSRPESPHKRGFVVSFGEFQPGQRFLGLRHVALDNGIEFGSLFSEPLITEVLRGEGVQASRCNFARLFLNGQPQGVYVNVERLDRTFLERNFGSSRGLLFKVDYAGPGTDLRDSGEPGEELRRCFEMHVGKEREAYVELREFIRAVNAPAVNEADLRTRFDLDAFLRTIAILLFAGAFDQYTGWNAHNYYLYQNPADHRWSYLPWDLDVGFADRAFDKVPVLEGWNAAWPAPVAGRPLLERVISNPKLLQSYRAQASRILETWFRPDVLIPKLRALHQRIRADLAEDPFPPRRATVPSDRGYEDILASMEGFIRQRYALAHAQLAAPGERPAFAPPLTPTEDRGPRPGPPSADAPTDLNVVKATRAGVELRWVNHTTAAVAYVVQRCAGKQATNFVNAIGQAGRDITTALDRDVQPGRTYRYRVYAVLPTPRGPAGTGTSTVVTVTIPDE